MMYRYSYAEECYCVLNSSLMNQVIREKEVEVKDESLDSFVFNFFSFFHKTSLCRFVRDGFDSVQK